MWGYQECACSSLLLHLNSGGWQDIPGAPSLASVSGVMQGCAQLWKQWVPRADRETVS